MNKLISALLFASLTSAQQSNTTTTTTNSGSVSQSPTVEQETCVFKDNDLQGFQESGTPFSDYDYLVAHESAEYVYKLNGVQLCTDDEGHLRGMEAFVGKYSTEHEGRLISTLAMNKIGDVSGACKTLQVDPLKGEYIQRIILRAGSDYVDAIWIGASTRDVIYNGNHPAQFTDKVLNFTPDEPLVGFWGTATLGEWIYSVGTVTVQSNCTVRYDPDTVPIEDINAGQTSDASSTGTGQSFMSQWHSTTGLDTETTVFVAAATTTVLVLAVAFAFGIAAHMRKKINTVQTVITITDQKDTSRSNNDLPDEFSTDKRMSVKKVNGKTEIHQEIDQNGTEIECTEDNEIGQVESQRNLSKNEIQQSEDVISGVDISRDHMPTPQRNKTFKVVTR